MGFDPSVERSYLSQQRERPPAARAKIENFARTAMGAPTAIWNPRASAETDRRFCESLGTAVAFLAYRASPVASGKSRV